MKRWSPQTAMLLVLLGGIDTASSQSEGLPADSGRAAGAAASANTVRSTPGIRSGQDGATGNFENLGSPSLDFQNSEEPVLVAPDAASYQFYITELESRYGPYAPGLSEQLLGLGSVYQKQGLHEEAAAMFKRGVHVARINDGLYSASQIPLLQGLIQSLVSTGEYDAADERQYYLYRVQREVYGRQSEQMSLAMLERAEWEREAYDLSLGETSFIRLLRMWELYSNVLRNVARSEGNLSEGLLTPLEGLLQTQYLISTYTPDAQMGLQTGPTASNDFAQENRFSMIRVSNYKQGQAVLTAMREVYGYNESEQSPLPTEALIRLGDWHLWHQKRDSALEAYRRAWHELGALDDGERLQQRYFGKPTLLPDLPGASAEPTPPAFTHGHVVVSYAVNDRGRVRDLEVLSTETVQDVDDSGDGNRVQLLRSLKRLLYRPKFEAGEPVQVDGIQERYAY